MIKIQKTICREELKSRIPALFAYIEENDAGEFRLHKATDSPQGCYGKIIENIKLPDNICLYIKELDDSEDQENPKYVLKSDEIYPYRTLMNYYYEYKNYEFTDDDDDSFISFIDTAIGKVEIDFKALGLDEENNDMVPHYIYLANARNLFNQYSKLKIVYDYYTGGYIKEVDGKLAPSTFDINNLEGDICCLCAKYVRMGGTIMYNKLAELIPESENIAKDYYDLAIKKDEEKGYKEKYAKSDFCNKNEDKNIQIYNTLTLKLNVILNQSIHDIGYLSCYLNEWIGGDKHYAGELYTYNGNTYVCIVDNNDVYDKEKMRFEFDDANFKKMSDVTTRDENITICNPFGNKWVIRDEDGNILTDDKSYNLYGSADSKLKSLRKYKNYINGEDKEEKPSDNEDWLYFYRKGVVINYTTVTDERGNIVSLSKPYNDDGTMNPAKDINDLMAYGNVIDDIDADQNNRTITFTYYINVHLKANKPPKEKHDDDGKPLYMFDGFYVDDKYHGIKYTETYNYEEGSELDKLIKGEIARITFEDYISDANETYVDFNKYAFSTIDSTVYYDKQLDTQIVSIPYVKSDYEVLIKNETDYLFADTFKVDYLDGITYEPSVDKDVMIDRGNYAAFERHLKLAEVKTMEDMENYSNNSFFNIQKVN